MRFAVLTLVCISTYAQAAEPWTTYRGNPARLGNTDGQPGPQQPKVEWVFRSQDHFVAAPVPVRDNLVISGLGAFNVATLYALPLASGMKPAPKWTKSTPSLKLPTVCSPAILGNLLIFGDGMHQTNGAILHGVRSDTGRTAWQLPVPGELVHLEGAPAVWDGKVYIGGGAAGVLAVDPSKLTLEGQELTASAIDKLLESKWKQLQDKYEEDKKKCADFAVPPNEDQLPKASPKLLWQQGKEKWHVDSPINAVAGKVLVGSAFLDIEKVGDRAVYCLNAADGAVLWRVPMQHNPWGGAAVAGETVVVGTSSIRTDPKTLKGAKGEIVALDLATGKEKWRKDIPGGVLNCPAVTEGIAVVCCTDGKVRAFDLATGDRKWIYEAKTPIFAPPALAGKVVYAADLLGTVHAIDLQQGTAKWTLSLASDPAVTAPGMVYAGPIVAGGKVFVTTCNIEGPSVGKPTVVVCIGAK